MHIPEGWRLSISGEEFEGQGASVRGAQYLCEQTDVAIDNLLLRLDPSPEDADLEHGEEGGGEGGSPSPLGSVCMTVLGQLSLSRCGVVSRGGHALLLADWADATAADCRIGGQAPGPHPPAGDALAELEDCEPEALKEHVRRLMGFPEAGPDGSGRCCDAITCTDDSSVYLHGCRVGDCWGGGLTVTDNATAVATETDFDAVGYGIGVGGNGRCNASLCSVTVAEDGVLECGAWYALEGCRGAQLRLGECVVRGPRWLGYRRPGVFEETGTTGPASAGGWEDGGEGWEALAGEEGDDRIIAELDGLAGRVRGLQREVTREEERVVATMGAPAVLGRLVSEMNKRLEVGDWGSRGHS